MSPCNFILFHFCLKIFLEVNFINTVTGEVDTDVLEIRTGSYYWLWFRRRRAYNRFLWRMRWYWRLRYLRGLVRYPFRMIRYYRSFFYLCRRRRQCAVAVGFSHDPSTGNTALFVNGRSSNTDFGDTTNLLLLTNGTAFVSNNQVACFDINNYEQNNCGYPRSSSNCFNYGMFSV